MNSTTDIFAFVLFVIIGILLAILLALMIDTPGRNECEKNLPRTQKCIQVWIPEVKNE